MNNITSCVQFTIDVSSNEIQLIEELFTTIGAIAVTYSDAGQELLLEPDVDEIKLWNLIRISALFNVNTDVDLLDMVIRSYLPANLAKQLKYRIFTNQDWEQIIDFPAKCFGKRLWICPDNQYPNQIDAVRVNLNPGLAFGTGAHPTTAMCLEWLDKSHLVNCCVLDYGCGSGILAIAAIKLGAKFVIAVDYDPQALEATHSNALKNSVVKQLHICSPDTCIETLHDVVLANILAGTLIALESKLAMLTRPGGQIILSGILAYQALQVISVYQQHFILEISMQTEEWVLLAGIRKDTTLKSVELSKC